MTDASNGHPGWRLKIHEIIFEADTPLGKLFDVALIACILLSVLAVMLDSVRQINDRHGSLLYAVEWIFTIVFTAEYLLRLLSVRRPLGYALSFFGIIDLLAVIPTYVSLVLPGAQYLLVLRLLRVLRIFRVLKLLVYLNEANVLLAALRKARPKIVVFMYVIVVLVCILGSIMYLLESAEAGFTSIPRSIYWAIVTLTTVGYGDISPQTNAGQTLAALVMILGYAMIAVPTGIVGAEITTAYRSSSEISNVACPTCSAEGHAHDAKFCKNCGAALHPEMPEKPSSG